MGHLSMSVYGTRGAATHWQEEVAREIVKSCAASRALLRLASTAVANKILEVQISNTPQSQLMPMSVRRTCVLVYYFEFAAY